MKIYIVVGETGEYDSHAEWMVKASLNKEEAEAYAKDCNAWFKDNQKEAQKQSGRSKPNKDDVVNKLDPSFFVHYWYGDADYSVEEVETIEK
jgi:hypothetical protein